MRLLADLMARGHADDPKYGNELLVEMLAGQAIAVAAYKNLTVSTLEDARRLVEQVSGYPGVGMRKTSEGSVSEIAAGRICDLLGVDWRSQP
jgi:hypothetical protein